MNFEDVYVLIGGDVGKCNHHAVVIDCKAKKIHDRLLPQTEATLRAIIKAVAGQGTAARLKASWSVTFQGWRCAVDRIYLQSKSKTH